MADVPVGTVTAVRLKGYRAIAEFTVENGRDIPVGTTASISSTSLLGENYIRLTRPDDPGSELVQDGDEIPTTGADASFEELTAKLLTVLRAINGRDVATIFEAGSEGIGGRSEELRGLLASVGQVTDGLVSQSEDLVAVIDSVAAAGAVLVDDAELIGTSIGQIADATGVVAAQGDRLADTLAAVTEVTATLDAEVIVPHRAELDRIFGRLAPIGTVLAANRNKVVDLLEALRLANTLLPLAVDGDEVLAYGLIDRFALPGGGLIDLGQILPLAGSDAVTALLSPVSPMEHLQMLLSPEVGP